MRNRNNINFGNDFDKAFNKTAKVAVGAWIVALLFNLVLWGVIIFAIVKLVLHFT